LIGAVGITLPSIVIVLILEDDARPPNPNIMLLAETVLVAGIFGLALPGMWTVSDVRLKALSNFPSGQAMESALDDEHANVRSTACRMMFDPRFDYDLRQATAVLYERPELAVPCLREVTQVEAANEVTRKLAVMWHQGLLGGTADQCINVAALDNLMIAEANRASMLLDCSLQAESAEVRKCCGDRIAVSYPGRKLLEQVKLSRDDLRQMDTSGALVAASFGEEVFLTARGNAAKQLGLQSDAYRRLSAELACTAIVNDEDGGDAESHMRWVFGEHDECITPEFADSPTKVREACELFLDDDSREDLVQSLCEANLAVRERTVEEAAKVRSGIDFSEFSGAIDSGRTRRNAEVNIRNYAELLESGRMQELSPRERAQFFRSARGMGRSASKSSDSEARRRLNRMLKARTNEDRMDEVRDELQPLFDETDVDSVQEFQEKLDDPEYREAMVEGAKKGGIEKTLGTKGQGGNE
jgi:hypothetical protein